MRVDTTGFNWTEHWYVPEGVNLSEVRNKAQAYARDKSTSQIVHHHPHGESCVSTCEEYD